MIDAHGERQTAEQAGRDVVDVRGAARDDLALHREFQQLQARQPAPRSSALAATTAATAEAAEPPMPEPSGMPFSMSISKPKFSAERRMHGLHRAAGRIVLRLDRQISGNAADGADAHHRLVDPPQPHPVADRLDRVSQNIEADADVGDGGWREGGDVGEHGILVTL